MILVRVRLAVTLFLVSLGAVVGAGVWSYRTALAAGMKGPAETSLFLALCAAGVLLLAAAAVLRQALRCRRELNSIADAVRYGGELPAGRLARLGSVGDRIRFILKELAEAGERKRERIASLSVLLRSVLEFVEVPLLVASLDGRVLEASRGATEDPHFKDLEPGKTSLQELLPDLELRKILNETDRTHAPVELLGHVTIHPVFSSRGSVGHFLVDLGRGGLREFLTDLGEKSSSAAEEVRKAGNGIFGRFYRRLRKKSEAEKTDPDKPKT